MADRWEALAAMNRPSVAVVVTSYNYERFLGQALESIFSQTEPADQVIVVDDGSTDGSRSLLEAYRDRAEVVLQENTGQGGAFNTAWKLLRTDVVLFLDADDLLLPNAIRSIRDAWVPGLAKLHWQMDVVDVHNRPTGGRQPVNEPPSGDLRALLREEGPVPVAFASPPTSGNAFSVSALRPAFPIDAHRWRTDADTVLLTVAPAMGAVLRQEPPLSVYRQHGDNASTRRCGRDALLRAVELTVSSAELLEKLLPVSRESAALWVEQSWAVRLLELWDLIVGAVPPTGATVIWDTWWTGWTEVEGRALLRPSDGEAADCTWHVIPWWAAPWGEARQVAANRGGRVLYGHPGAHPTYGDW